MTRIVTWCAKRARMVMALILVSVAAGLYSCFTLPKEGPSNIDIPVLYVSVPLPGVSAVDPSDCWSGRSRRRCAAWTGSSR